MSWPFNKRDVKFLGASDLLNLRTAARSSRRGVSNETALRHSAVWACLRLRANMVSTMPVDLFRRVSGVAVDMPKPPILTMPGGEKVDIGEWMYSTQFDLDRAGNCFGLITQTDRYGLPAQIELLSLGDVSVVVKGGQIASYKVGGDVYAADKVWHEKQYTVAGLHVGLSPVAYAAASIDEYLSIQEFANDWFGNSAVPSAHLRNVEEELVDPIVAQAVKERFKSSVRAGEPFVSGKDWEYHPLTASNEAMNWIDGKNFGIADIARFFDCPADLIDAAVAGNDITYANITQRNLQFLILHLQPAITRRENALTRLTPKPQFVKLNTNALLRMDPATRATTNKILVDARVLAPSEWREQDDRPPLTDAQMAEFDRLFGTKNPAPAAQTKPTGVSA